ncbi:MAG: NAD-dependent epimerase/dehydratase family protein [Erysipelotrichaceae bacterium]|nr:NAD-dependent epimerase/dehydratase family protein [Erysipelotrichaceae bacterium]
MRAVFLGCGYLGSNLYQLLKDSFDTEMWGIDSPYVSRIDSFRLINVFDPDAMKDMDVRDALVIDTVALVANSDRSENEAEALDVLAEKYRALFSVLKQGGCRRFVFFSSGGTVYGSHARPRRESDPLEPQTLYARSKVRIEEELKASGLDYLILRLSNPYGGYQLPNKRQGVIPIVLRKAYLDESFQLMVNPDSIRDYIYISDFASQLKKLLEMDVSDTTLNVGSGKGTSLQTVIDLCEKITGKTLRIEHMLSQVPMVQDIVLDVSKLEGITGIHSSISMAEGMRMEDERIRRELGIR